jgi:hypothetical protein
MKENNLLIKIEEIIKRTKEAISAYTRDSCKRAEYLNTAYNALNEISELVKSPDLPTYEQIERDIKNAIDCQNSLDFYNKYGYEYINTYSIAQPPYIKIKIGDTEYTVYKDESKPDESAKRDPRYLTYQDVDNDVEKCNPYTGEKFFKKYGYYLKKVGYYGFLQGQDPDYYIIGFQIPNDVGLTQRLVTKDSNYDLSMIRRKGLKQLKKSFKSIIRAIPTYDEERDDNVKRALEWIKLMKLISQDESKPEHKPIYPTHEQISKWVTDTLFL